MIISSITLSACSTYMGSRPSFLIFGKFHLLYFFFIFLGKWPRILKYAIASRNLYRRMGQNWLVGQNWSAWKNHLSFPLCPKNQWNELQIVTTSPYYNLVAKNLAVSSISWPILVIKRPASQWADLRSDAGRI